MTKTLDVTCPKCHRKAGFKCRSVDWHNAGMDLMKSHPQRVKAAKMTKEPAP